MGHEHSHCDDHSHSHHHHTPASYNLAFALGVTLNMLFVIAEASYGYLSHSLALLADAGHNLSDVLGLILAWGAIWLSRRRPSPRYTYGLRSSSILAAVTNAVILLLTVGAIVWQAIARFGAKEVVETNTVMIVAAVGIVINSATALLFMSGRKTDLNIRGAFTHMAADALISLGVVIAAGVMSVTGWMWLDPALSLVISVIIFLGTIRLLRESINLAVAAVPTNIEPGKVKDYLALLKGVSRVHDLHIWAMSTTEVALTAHLVMPEGHPGDRFITDVCRQLKHTFQIQHTTLQIELGDGDNPCALEPDEVV